MVSIVNLVVFIAGTMGTARFCEVVEAAIIQIIPKFLLVSRLGDVASPVECW